MSTVHVLDENTINKIAAGEVVERPASVVKELVENAIDAGAKRIEVESMAGGTSFIRVTDDGCGMSGEDARLAIERHATSKIRQLADIENIGTLGFRGEALPTIASVSRFSLLTRPAGSELGTAVTVEGGRNTEVREAGCNVGTTVRVEDLFFNTPARKKFLKTTNTEGSKINDFIIKLALARPDITFRYISNNKPAVTTPGSGSLKDTVQSIYGMTVGSALLELKLSDPGVTVSGFITKPSMLRSSRAWQTFIVNGRIVTNKAIAKAVDNAYHSLLPKSGYPLVVLKLEVPADTVDVNVHPQKLEIKFDDEGRIFKAVYKAVLDAVRSTGSNLGAVAAAVQRPERHFTEMTLPLTEKAPERPPVRPLVYMQDRPPIKTGGRQTAGGRPDFSEVQKIIYEEKAGSINKTERAAAKPEVEMAGLLENMQCRETAPCLTEAPTDRAGKPEVGKLTPLGQVGRCYIVASDAGGLYIIDQHAAHERIMYDKFSGLAEEIPSQQMLMHLVLEFSPGEADLVGENLELFRQLGFDMSACGDREFRLMSVPSDIFVSEAEETVREILAELDDRPRVTAAEIRHACIATMACRAAIKAGEEMNLKQMELLIDELANTARPYTCPHGRPTILRFSVAELAKMFKRT